MKGIEEKYVFIVSSTYRQRVIRGLQGGPKNVTNLANFLKMERPHVSKTLKELERAGFVTCLTPEQKIRIYALTKDGEWACKYVVLKRIIIEMIDDLLTRAKIPYVKSPELVGTIFNCTPDFILPSLETPEVALEVRSFEDTEIKAAVFDVMELKRIYGGLKFFIVVVGTKTRDNVLIRLKESKYFDQIFLEDQLEQLIEHIRENNKNAQSAPSAPIF